jgi:histone H2B
MPASEGPKKSVKGGGKRRKKEPTLGSYIYKVHKQVHPSLGISSKAIGQINGILNEVLERMTTKSAEIARVGKKSTLSARHVQGAVPLTMGFELAKHAVSEGTKAVSKFAAH